MTDFTETEEVTKEVIQRIGYMSSLDYEPKEIYEILCRAIKEAFKAGQQSEHERIQSELIKIIYKSITLNQLEELLYEYINNIFEDGGK